MAIFHLERQIIKRSAERSTVACAAYRSGETLYDERQADTKKSGDPERVVSTWITAPDFAGSWATDRSQLWNCLEAAEKRKDAQLAVEIECALPHEMSLRQQKELIAGFVDEHFTQLGRVADVAIHAATKGKTPNTHFHVMGPLRLIDPETGDFRKTKDRQDSKTAFTADRDAELEALRASWAAHVNRALEKAGYEDRKVDHRSHKDRGLEELPGIKEGYAARGIEARGGLSWRAEHNRQIRQRNQILAQIKARATQAANAAKRAAAAIADGFQQFARGPGETVPKSSPKPAPPPVWQPPPMRKPDKLQDEPRPVVADVEAEKRKKAAHEAAWRQQGGGGGVGG
jgi:hypothetical protein